MKNILITIAVLLLSIPVSAQVSYQPVNPDATPEAKALLAGLYKSVEDGNIISGLHHNQLNMPNYIYDLDRIDKASGKTPMIWGGDLAWDARQVVEIATREYNRGRIITLMWHVNRPFDRTPRVDFRSQTQGDFSDSQWKELVTEGTKMNTMWKEQVDSISNYLKVLKDRNIPVLWRPYHEMNGEWFWWGDRKGEEGFAKLWKMMYDRMVNHHHLDNLIWVWNANAPRQIPGDSAMAYDLYYPGNDYVDVLATDVYHNDWKQEHHDQLVELGKGKLIALGELGDLPTPEVLASMNRFAWFMIWTGFTNDRYNTLEELGDIFNLPNVVTYTGASGIQAFQGRRQMNPADTLKSIVTNADGSVSFRIYAPEAKSVELAGDFSGYKARFTKDDKGIWTAVIPKVSTDAYRYHFVVDGVKVIDPRHPLFSESVPIAHMTNGEDIFWARRNVPHGPVSQISYCSSTTGKTRSMHVWTPAGNASWKKLPVLYLIHGGGDNDVSWSTIGCANDILDNLYAEGKIEPMIVVMPHGGMDTKLFVKELTDDIMPRIEAQFQVRKGAANTAIAGLSMGGLETLNTITAHPDMFGYINVMSSGWFRSSEEDFARKTELLKDIAPVLNKTARILRFTMGGQEDFAYPNCQKTLECFKAAGIDFEYSETPGGHSWHVWHYDLRDLAPRLFK